MRQTYNFATYKSGKAPQRQPGKSEYNFLCDRCGVARNSTDLHREWTGLIVCSRCLDPKRMLDFPPPTPVEHDFPATNTVRPEHY